MPGLAEWLLEDDLVSAEQLEQARARQNERGVPLEIALLELKLLKEDTLVDLLSRRHGLPKAPSRLHRLPISLKALSTVPQDLCWQCGMFPFGIDGNAGRLQLAVTNPDEFDPKLLSSLAGYTIDLYLIGPRHLEKAIRKHYLDSTVEDTGAEPRRRFFGYDEEPTPVPTMGDLTASLGDVEFAPPRMAPQRDLAGEDPPPLFPPGADHETTAPASPGEPLARLTLPELVGEKPHGARPDRPSGQRIPGVPLAAIPPMGANPSPAPRIPDGTLATPDDLASLAPPHAKEPVPPPGPTNHELTLFERVAALEQALGELLDLVANGELDAGARARAEQIRARLKLRT